MKRWKATIEYRSEVGVIDVEHVIEEICELQDLVERGPDWNSIIRIIVTLARKTRPGLTIEGADIP
ncbi:MAG TPA: hypothetical protein VK181_23255 [Rhizobium sp.]|nr:hypothetical protein [Rhizobium sp.]